MGEHELLLRQHFFDSPVAQPRGLLNRHADLSGLRLWPTSRPFLARLQKDILPAMRKQSGGSRPLRVLELGSGCGLLGIGVAALGEEVVLTDPAINVNLSEDEFSNTLQRLKDNLDLNRGVTQGRATAEKLVWGDEQDMQAIERRYGAAFDLILGCDLLYNPDSYPSLLQTMRRFSEGGRAPVLLGYPPRLPGEVRFFEAVRQHFDVHVESIWAGNDMNHEGLLAQCRAQPTTDGAD